MPFAIRASTQILILFMLLLFTAPLLSVYAIECIGGAEHRYNAYGACTVCGMSAAAERGGIYYGTLTEALADADAGDTVSVLYDSAPADTRYEIAEGITLLCKAVTFHASVCNCGVIEGGRFVGAVENHGLMRDATLSGELVCYPDSEVQSSHLSGVLCLYGGSITGGRIGMLTLRLRPSTPMHGILLDLRNATLSDAALTLVNEAAFTLSAECLLLPEGYALFPSTGEGRYTDSLAPNDTLILEAHIHTPSHGYSYDANTHYIPCAVCGYADPSAKSPHSFVYASADNGRHSARCTDCGCLRMLPHSGGKADCHTPAICAFCQTPYGEKDPEAHRPAEDGSCTLCGYRFAAVCGSIFYKTAEEALAAAVPTDTVILLADNREPLLTVKEGVTLDCRTHSLLGGLTNRGTLMGGTLYGRVENHGRIEGASLYGELENHGIIPRATLACTVKNLAGGRIVNASAGDILIGDGFSLGIRGQIDCAHHFGGTASCTASALCRLCGTPYGARLSHSFSAYSDNRDATCVSDRTETAICAHCGMTDTVTVSGSRLPHRDKNADGKCDYCALVLEVPGVTTAPPTTQAPSTTARPSTQSPTPPPHSPTPEVSGEPVPIPTALLRIPWWLYATIGLIFGGFAALSIIKRD